MSSVQLLDEAAAERQRVELINRLVKEQIFPADFDGGWALEEGSRWVAGACSWPAPAGELVVVVPGAQQHRLMLL
jgi:hypothetical protein